MGLFRRDRRTLNERLMDDLDARSDGSATEAVAPEPLEEVEPLASRPAELEDTGGYWDVVVDAVDGELREDSYEFASLASGDLVVEENVEESLAALADAVDAVLDGAYRAVAVRQGPDWWAVSARRIRVVPLSLRGERARLVSAGGRLDFELDGQPLQDTAAAAELTAQAADLGDDYAVDATYLDSGLWEVTASIAEP